MTPPTPERDRIRAALLAVYVNHVGQVEAEWERTDAESRRRAAILRDLRVEMRKGVDGLGQTSDRAEYIADSLTGYIAGFVLSLDDGTWEPGDG